MEIQIIAKEFYEHSLYFKGFSKETIKRYKYTVDLYCKIMEVQLIEQVTQQNVRALFFHGRTVRQWSPNTAIIFHKSLHVFFTWCISKHYMDFNPIDDIERPKLQQKLPKKLTKQDAHRLLEIVYNYPYTNRFLRYRNHAIFATFMFAGLRKSELLNLKYADVDIENLTIFVNQGKGSKDRFIPMSQTLAKSLRNYVEERKRCKKTCPEFFTSQVQNTGLTQFGLKHFVDKVQTVFGTRFSVHKLRHTFATLMLEGGCDIYSLSKMMGHSDIKTTTIYLYASADHLRSQMLKHPMNE
ncbi:tyrosine-type recombinase/integrase [Ferruginibacter sp.]|nr:tyrosine-type recombinase/integrase [Ferruginibacter sp.]